MDHRSTETLLDADKNGVLRITIAARGNYVRSEDRKTYLEHYESVLSQSGALHGVGGRGTRISGFEMGIFDVSHCLI